MATRSWRPAPNTDLSGGRQPVPLACAPRQSRTLATPPRASLVARPGLDSPPFPGLVCCPQKKNGAPRGAPLETLRCCLGSVAAAGRAARLHRGVIGIAGLDHLDALARGVLRRDALVLDARRRHHHGLRHHHGAVLRRRAVRDGRAGRHHHGLVDGAVLRRDVLLLVAGLARRRRVAIVAAGGRRARHRDRSDGGRENNSKSTRHCGGAPVARNGFAKVAAVYAAKSRAAEVRRGILNASAEERAIYKDSLTMQVRRIVRPDSHLPRIAPMAAALR